VRNTEDTETLALSFMPLVRWFPKALGSFTLPFPFPFPRCISVGTICSIPPVPVPVPVRSAAFLDFFASPSSRLSLPDLIISPNGIIGHYTVLKPAHGAFQVDWHSRNGQGPLPCLPGACHQEQENMTETNLHYQNQSIFPSIAPE
jgi:hypothetical protein